MTKIKNLKDKVRRMLALHPDTRNSDITLTIRMWKEYSNPLLIHREKDNRYYVALEDLFNLPREDNIKRHRAKIQAPKPEGEGLYPPTDEKVLKQRNKLRKEWHTSMSNVVAPDDYYNNYDN